MRFPPDGSKVIGIGIHGNEKQRFPLTREINMKRAY